MSVRLRRAVADDAPALSSLALASKASNGYDAAFMEACIGPLTMGRAEIEAADVRIACDEAGAMLGFFSRMPCDPSGTAELHMMFVAPSAKRRGIGRLLWEAMEEGARRDGVTRLELDADPFAVPFYSSMGMEIVGESPSDAIAGRMLPRMAKTLDRTLGKMPDKTIGRV